MYSSLNEMLRLQRRMQAEIEELRNQMDLRARQNIFNVEQDDRFHQLEEEQAQLDKAIQMSLEEERKKKIAQERQRILGTQRAPIVLDAQDQQDNSHDEELDQAIQRSLEGNKPKENHPLNDDEVQQLIMDSIKEEAKKKTEKNKQEELDRDRILDEGYEDMDIDDLEFTKAMSISLADAERAKKEKEALELERIKKEEEKEKEKKREERERKIIEREQRQLELEDAELEAVLERSLEEAKKDEERREREARAKLQQEQEQEYQESLRKDREREEEKKRQELEVLKKQQEEEEKEELEKALEFSKVLTKNQIISRLEASLPPQPTSTTGITDIAIRMPDGSRINRKFLASQKLQVLKDFVDLHGYKTQENYSRDQYELATSFPSKPIKDLNQTFEQAGLLPRALVNVQIVS